MRSLIDIGYTWPWTRGHLVVTTVAALALLAAWRFRWHWSVKVLAGVIFLWSVAAFLVVTLVFRFNEIPQLPTEAFLASSGPARVLDLGAGSGRSSIMVLWARPQTTLVALDNFSASYIRGHDAQKTLANFRAAGVDQRATVQPGDMRQLPFPDASFDAIVSAYAIDHLDRDGITATLQEASRVLRPHGEFLLQVMYPDAWMRFAWGPMMLHGARGDRLRARWTTLLGEAGFDVREVGTQPISLYLLARKR
jgi:SAM-dependent methyltransferase